MEVRIISNHSGKEYIVTRELVDYYDTHRVPVVGISREFLSYLMDLARSTRDMSRREYIRLKEEIVSDAVNIYQANRRRNKRRRRQ
mgnify:CR=1 FL=1